jgi:uncharacterized protein
MVWSDDQARSLHTDIDSWIINEDSTDLYQVIEDELILSMPIIAYHNYECVPESLFSAGSEIEVDQSSTVDTNPFHVLKKLKS